MGLKPTPGAPRSRREALRLEHDASTGGQRGEGEWSTPAVLGGAVFLVGCCLLLPFLLMSGLTLTAAVLFGAPLWLVLVLGVLFSAGVGVLVGRRLAGSEE